MIQVLRDIFRFFRRDLRYLRRCVLLQSQIDRLLERQPHHAARRIWRQAILFVGLRA